MVYLFLFDTRGDNFLQSATMMYSFCFSLFTVVFMCLILHPANGYISYSIAGQFNRNSDLRNCPEKCQCMALNRRGPRGLLNRWDTASQWRGRSGGISSFLSDSTSDGRSMVCQGLRRLPNPIPTDIITLTIYGDSSGVVLPSASPGQQNDHYRPLITSTQLRHINRDSFRGNRRLSEITLSGNNIGVLYPYIFNHLRSLRRLSLQNNNIRHLSAAVFRGLSPLVELEMSDNMIQYLPQAVFNYVPNLKTLNLNGNKIQRLQRNQFKSLVQLRRLDLSRNNITDFYDDSFDRNVKLEELLLSGNRISMIRARWFRNLYELRILSLRGNIITHVAPDSFSNLYNLEELLLSANHIDELQDESFRNLRKLKVLDLATNDISEIEQSSFVGLRSLEELYMANNKLNYIRNGTFGSLRTVKRLDISRNNIETVENEVFYPLRILQYLDISHNKLRTLLHRFLFGLIELKEVNLDHNFIRVIQRGAFMTSPGSSMSKVSSVSLEFNDLRKLESESLVGLTNLKSLSLSNNRIRRVHSLAFSSLSNMKTLNLNKNRIKNLNNGAFRSLRNLINLDLSDNKLRSIPSSMFAGLRNVEELSLASNGIHDISKRALQSLNNLYELNLGENKLMNFNFSLVSHMRTLFSLDLSDNHLFWVDVPQNTSLGIKELFLAENNLQTIKKDIKRMLKSSAILSLTGNPLTCDCQLTWLRDPAIARQMQIEQYDELLCRAPKNLHGKKVSHLKIEELSCSSRQHTSAHNTLVCSDAPDMKATKYNGRTAVKAMIGRHVTVLDDQRSPKFNGILLQNNWALVPGNAVKDIQQSTSSDVRVKIGRRKGMRRVIHSIRHPLGSMGMEQFNIGLLHLDGNDQVDPVCLMTVNQFDTVTRILPRISVTTRLDGRKPLSKLKARNGRIQPKCYNPNYLCVKVNGKGNGKKKMLLEGSPMFLRQPNALKVAGIGTDVKDPKSLESLFIPLWTVTEWLDQVIHEYNTKCPIEKRNKRCIHISLPTANDLLTKVRRPERH